MRHVRKFFLFIASSLLVTLLVSTATFWIFNNTVGDRTVVNQWFNDSGIYDNFIDEVVSATTKQTSDYPDVASIDAETLSGAAGEAFSAEFLQATLESALDSGYNWLEQDTEKLELSLDFTEVKNSFATALGDSVISKAESLPACDTFDFPSELDIFSAECLPPGADPSALAEDFKSSILASEDLLPDPIIDAEDIKFSSNDGEKRIDEAFNKAPDWYRTATSMAWVFTGLSILAIVGVVFLAATRRKGLFHITKSLALAALSVSIIALISKSAPLSISGVGGSDEAAKGFSENIIEPFLEQAIDSFARLSYIIAAVYAILVVVILTTLFFTRKKHTKETEKTGSDAAVAKDAKDTETTEQAQETDAKEEPIKTSPPVVSDEATSTKIPVVEAEAKPSESTGN
jgi:hypothetical protein